MKLEMTQKQELKLTPQMLQSMELLQMSAQELEAYLQELVQENPAAELSEPEERQDEGRSCGGVCSHWPTRTTRTGSTLRRAGGAGPAGPDRDGRRTGGHPSAPSVPAAGRSQAPTLVLRALNFGSLSGRVRLSAEEVENLAQAAGLPAAVLEEG